MSEKARNLSNSHRGLAKNRSQKPRYCSGNSFTRPCLMPMDTRVTTSHYLLEVPLEIWEQIAAFSRQAIARLCSVSHAFYSGFAPLLYSMTTEPPLTSTQSNRLIRTLSTAQSSPRKPYLMQLIKSVSFPEDLRRWQCHDALRNLFEVSSSGRSIRGAALRTLKWNSSETEALGILLRSGYFPSLKEVSVSSARDLGKDTSFDYIRIPGLEKLECSWKFGNNYETWPRLFSALGKALQILPSSSPLLHTFKFRFTVCDRRYDWPRANDTPYWSAYTELLEKINRLRFSALTSLEMSVPPHRKALTDFGSILLGHPILTNVVLDVSRMIIPTSLSPKSLRLRSFTGSAEQCAAVSAHAPELELLSILLAASTDEPLFHPAYFPPHLAPTLRSLTVRAKYTHPIFMGELSPRSLDCLVVAFPNLTCLDIRLGEAFKINQYRDAFVALHELECLRMHPLITVREGDLCKPAKVLFPAEHYQAKINETLCPFLPRLSEVHMFIFGQSWVFFGLVEYRFTRNHRAREFVLVETKLL
ncbi:hypothetical protein B0H19DRAFT_1184927 [Mycena capillaripes]|nr:hypothetical protein B0H19DRAFT_1184927 [Mycena capillaripes]